MQIKYVHSAFGMEPNMLITASDYLKAFDGQEDEYRYLSFSVDAFAAGHGFENNLKYRDYHAAKGWLMKTSIVLFVVKERNINPIRYNRWCEIYVVTAGEITNVITSDDGEILCQSKEKVRDVAQSCNNAPSNKKCTLAIFSKKTCHCININVLRQYSETKKP